MITSQTPPKSSTLARSAGEIVLPQPALDEEDFAIGCECANPALQIETWGREATAQPLQQFY
jgi:hypothetical protein